MPTLCNMNCGLIKWAAHQKLFTRPASLLTLSKPVTSLVAAGALSSMGPIVRCNWYCQCLEPWLWISEWSRAGHVAHGGLDETASGGSRPDSAVYEDGSGDSRPPLRQNDYNCEGQHLVATGDSKKSMVSNLIQTLKSWISGDRVRIALSHGRSLIHCNLMTESLLQTAVTLFKLALTDDADPQCTRLVYELLDQKLMSSRHWKSSCEKMALTSMRVYWKDGPTPRQFATPI